MSQKLATNYNSGVICHDISDHFPCLVIVKQVNCSKKEPLTITSRQLKEKNISLINHELENIDWHTLLKSESVSDNFELFHSKIMQVVDRISPEKNYTIPAKKVIKEPWLTTGLLKCVKKQGKLYKEFLKNRTVETDLKYKTYRNTLQRIKRKCKRTYYYNQCNDHRSNTKKLWKIINNVCSTNNDKSNIIDCLKINNIYHYNSKEITNKFGQYFSTIGEKCASKLSPSKTPIKDYLEKIQTSPTSVFLEPCTHHEVDKLISNLPNKTSSGFDGISNILLKKIRKPVIPVLVSIFNQSFTDGEFPTLMKHAEIVPLFKSGKTYECTNYRPISLLITLSKVLEKLMYQRIYSFLNKNNLIYASQYGFRSKHSCEHAILELMGEIVKNQTKGNHTIAIFLDLSKAFDTLQHSVLYSKLDKYGIRGNALKWFKSYLNNRSLNVKCTVASSGKIETSDKFTTNFGTPQGSCLGPLLFLIFCNDLHNVLQFCHSILFADDTTVYKSHKNLRYLKWCIEEDLRTISDWLRANKLTLNLNKTVSILFPKNNKAKVTLEVSLDDQQVSMVDHTKFLGVWIDNNLKWHSHLSKLHLKLNQGTGMIRKAKNFLDTRCLKILYYAQFFSHICYCISIWGNMLTEGQLNKLQRLQDNCVSMLNNSTTPDYTGLKIPKVRELIKLENYKFAHKLIHQELPAKVIKAAMSDHKGNSLMKSHPYGTRQKKLINTPSNANTNYLNSILCKGVSDFKTLSAETRDIPSYKSFVSKCKKQLLT